MKNIFTFFILLIISSSCHNNQNEKPELTTTSDSVIVYDIYKYEELKKHAEASGKRLIVIDTACINGKERARKDIEKGKLTYYFFGGNFTSTCEVKRVKEFFLEKGIKTDYAYGPAGCIPLIGYEEFHDLCYEEAMNREFEKRNGKTFTDSMMVVNSASSFSPLASSNSLMVAVR